MKKVDYSTELMEIIDFIRLLKLSGEYSAFDLGRFETVLEEVNNLLQKG